jgi:hypothetical protein
MPALVATFSISCDFVIAFAILFSPLKRFVCYLIRIKHNLQELIQLIAIKINAAFQSKMISSAAGKMSGTPLYSQ